MAVVVLVSSSLSHYSPPFQEEEKTKEDGEAAVVRGAVGSTAPAGQPTTEYISADYKI